MASRRSVQNNPQLSPRAGRPTIPAVVASPAPCSRGWPGSRCVSGWSRRNEPCIRAIHQAPSRRHRRARARRPRTSPGGSIGGWHRIRGHSDLQDSRTASNRDRGSDRSRAKAGRNGCHARGRQHAHRRGGHAHGAKLIQQARGCTPRGLSARLAMPAARHCRYRRSHRWDRIWRA